MAAVAAADGRAERTARVCRSRRAPIEYIVEAVRRRPSDKKLYARNCLEKRRAVHNRAPRSNPRDANQIIYYTAVSWRGVVIAVLLHVLLLFEYVRSSTHAPVLVRVHVVARPESYFIFRGAKNYVHIYIYIKAFTYVYRKILRK